MAAFYLVKSGNWSNPAIWSLTQKNSGGGDGVPTATDGIDLLYSGYTLTLDQDIEVQYITHYESNIDCKSYSVTINGGGYNGGSQSSRYLKMGSAQWTLNNCALNFANSGSLSVTSCPLIVMNTSKGSLSLTNGNSGYLRTLHNLTINLNTYSAYLCGPLKLDTLTINKIYTGQSEVKFVSGSGLYVEANDIVVNNTSSSAHLTLNTWSSGQYFYLKSGTSSDITVDYVDVGYSVASGAGSFSTRGGADLGNNSGWDFLAPPNNPPTATILSPSNGSSLLTNKPQLKFVGVDNESDNITYELQIDTLQTFNSTNLIDKLSTSDSGFSGTDPYSSGSDVTYTFQNALTGASVWYWRVRAKDPSGSNSWGNWSSINSFTIPVTPTASFSIDNNLPYNSVGVNFTDTSVGKPTSWSWDFGDGKTSTSQNPSHTYTSDGTYTVALTASNSVGSNTVTKTDLITVSTIVYNESFISSLNSSGKVIETFESATIDIISDHTSNSRVVAITTYQAISQKYYEYRVKKADGTFLSIWSDVDSDFSYSQSINQNASEVDVSLARSPNNTAIVLDTLKDENSDPILDENSNTISVQTMTANAVGPDTDVDLNYNVDTYAFYGGYDSLIDENGDYILDENSEQILTQFGAPNGVRVFAGYIATYGLLYGTQTGVDVTVVPNATDLGQYVFMDSSGNTTITYDSTDPIQIARDAMDNYAAQGGVITYDEASLPLSSQTATYTFSLQTIDDVIDQVIKLLPGGYYSYVNPGENKLYILQKNTVADHVFYYEKHISDMNLSKSIIQLVNKVYFVGGVPDGEATNLFKFYDDDSSITEYRAGLEIMQNGSVTLTDSAALLANQEINEFNEPHYTTSVTIYDNNYDIESIHLGQMVGFKNFGTYVDNLLLQVVTISRSPHFVTLSLDMIVPTDTKRLYELKKQLQEQQIVNIGASPS